MKLALLAACCALVAFAAANAAGSALFVAHWRARRERWMTRPAAALLLARSLPAVASAVFAALTVLPAFLIHEPRDRVETVGPALALAASAGLLLLGAAAVRGLGAAVRTSRAARRWTRGATPVRVPGWDGPALLVRSDEPGACVVGILRPTLLLSRGALAAWTAGELAGIVAHERAHARAGDVRKRLLLRALPDAVAWTRAGAESAAIWQARAEEEADASAAAGDRARGAELAGALVKLARRRTAPALPLATAFDAGGPIERRVRRLLATTGPAPGSACGSACGRIGARVALAAASGIVALAALAAGTVPALSIRVHHAIEAVVRALT